MPEPIPPAELEAILARADAATQGPWHAESVKASYMDADVWLVKYRWDDVPTWLFETSSHRDGKQNTEFICAARADVPRLVAEVRRLRKLAEDRDEGFPGAAAEIDGTVTP